MLTIKIKKKNNKKIKEKGKDIIVLRASFGVSALAYAARISLSSGIPSGPRL